MMFKLVSIFLLLNVAVIAQDKTYNDPFIIILGIAQDAGYPQAGCEKDCCKRVLTDASAKRMVTSLALADPATHQWWLFDATPDITAQLQLFRSKTNAAYPILPAGIFLTHGHIGHYTGLMYFGREAMNTRSLPVYAMSRMNGFLVQNGPWDQLFEINNLSMRRLRADSSVNLSTGITVTPFLVPHRDEYSETVGFSIQYQQFKLIYIPDIDKWKKFGRDINLLVKESSVALLDGTFFKDGELAGRAMNEIPHPFVEESMLQFSTLAEADKKKIHFIHLNHTNPLLDKKSVPFAEIKKKGFNIAEQGEKVVFR